MFGGLSLGLANSGKIKTDVGQLTPTMSVGVEEVYDSAKDTFRHVNELLPKVQHDMIKSQKELEEYVKAIKSSGVYAIDTEVDGLNPRVDRIAGISIYTPGQNPAYIPINHSFYEENLDARHFVRALAELDVFVIMHNSAYDRRVLYNYAQVWIPCSLDTMAGAHALNENEPKGLKYQWNKYCMDNLYEEKTYSDLFENRKFSTFDPERVLVYATLDAYMTYQLGQFQMQYLNIKQDLCKQLNLESVAHAFWNIEMPVLDVATRMEERGINFDLELNKKLQVKYEKSMRDVEERIHGYLDKLLPVIKDRIPPAKFHALGNPVNIASGDQIATIIYDGMGLELSEALKKSAEVTAKKSKRKGGPNYRMTGREAIEYFMEEYPTYKEFFKNLLEHRGISKIYGTYIIGLRKEIDPYSKRIHGRWNTLGTDTGRMSSRSPNL